MNVKKLVVLGFLISVAVALQIFEAYIPIVMPVPGGKLGFANIVTIVVMIIFGGKEAIMVAFVRSLLGSLMYGGFINGIYSITAATGSALLTVLLYSKFKCFSLVGISVSAALIHNLLQVLVAVILFENVSVFTYYPILMLISIPCGVLTGLVSGYIKNIIYKK